MILIFLAFSVLQQGLRIWRRHFVALRIFLYFVPKFFAQIEFFFHIYMRGENLWKQKKFLL